MTWGELHDYVNQMLANGDVSEIDWRPASDMYINDIVKIFNQEGQYYIGIPQGIRMWLSNGDSLIYVKKVEGN